MARDMARQRNPVIVRPSQRRRQSRWQKEQSRQRAIIVGGVIAILFILGIPAYGYWSNFIAPPRSVVLQVDDTKYTVGFMAKYLKGLQKLGTPPDMSVEPFRILQLLQEDELVRSGAISKGVTLDPSEIDQEIRDRIIGSSPKLADVPPDQLDREFNETYRQYLNTANLSEKEHRRLVEGSLLRNKLTEVLGAEVPEIAKQANISWIVISSKGSGEDEETASLTAQRTVKEVSDRLKQGEDFAAVAEQFSQDRNTAVKGGQYGWVPEGAFGILDKTIFSLEPGGISEGVNVDDDTFFIKVTEVAEARTIEPGMKDILKRGTLQQWLAQERGNHRISTCFGGGSAGGSCDWQYDWLVKQLREAAPKPTPSG
jgi:hypothetical protein